MNWLVTFCAEGAREEGHSTDSETVSGVIAGETPTCLASQTTDRDEGKQGRLCVRDACVQSAVQWECTAQVHGRISGGVYKGV